MAPKRGWNTMTQNIVGLPSFTAGFHKFKKKGSATRSAARIDIIADLQGVLDITDAIQNHGDE